MKVDENTFVKINHLLEPTIFYTTYDWRNCVFLILWVSSIYGTNSGVSIDNYPSFLLNFED